LPRPYIMQLPGSVEPAGGDETAAAGAERAGRDLRIDLFRGLALMMIFVGHQEVFSGYLWLRRLSLGSWCFCDALEVFIFLSGYVCAISYGRELARRGLRSCQAKSVRRCGELYVANLITYLAVASVALAVTSPPGVIAATFLGPAIERPEASLCRFLTMRYHPIALNLLHLYIFLLLLTPATLRLMQRRAGLALVLSGACYWASQWARWVDLEGLTIGMNVFAWQFLYVLGLYFGARGGEHRRTSVFDGGLAAVSAVVLAAFVMIRAGLPLAAVWGLPAQKLLEVVPGEEFAVESKLRLHPLRLLNFLALAQVVAWSCPASSWVARQRWLKPLVSCGMHSLEVFCLGVLLNYVGALVIIPRVTAIPLHISVPAYDVIGMIGLMGFGVWRGMRAGEPEQHPEREDLSGAPPTRA
jgi:hypothetical protein